MVILIWRFGKFVFIHQIKCMHCLHSYVSMIFLCDLDSPCHQTEYLPIYITCQFAKIYVHQMYYTYGIWISSYIKQQLNIYHIWISSYIKQQLNIYHIWISSYIKQQLNIYHIKKYLWITYDHHWSHPLKLFL